MSITDQLLQKAGEMLGTTAQIGDKPDRGVLLHKDLRIFGIFGKVIVVCRGDDLIVQLDRTTPATDVADVIRGLTCQH